MNGIICEGVSFILAETLSPTTPKVASLMPIYPLLLIKIGLWNFISVTFAVSGVKYAKHSSYAVTFTS